MTAAPLHVVTGAFSYTGRYLTRELLARGIRVRTLTNHPHRPHPFGSRVEAAPLDFADPAGLASSLQGAGVLYNTYWVRFAHGKTTFEGAVENTKTLVRAAREAGVRRLVHVSIANPDPESDLPYYRGKGQLEAFIRQSGLSHAIVRPAVLFGGETAAEDVLLNNIAWLLRRLPVFAVPGDGRYGIQPIAVEDMARLMAGAGERTEDETFDAVGPEVYTFRELVDRLRAAVGSRAAILHLPPGVALGLARGLGMLVGDVMLTRDEVRGLMANLLVSAGPPTGTTRLSDWLAAHADLIGARYASEVGRHFR